MSGMGERGGNCGPTFQLSPPHPPILGLREILTQHKTLGQQPPPPPPLTLDFRQIWTQYEKLDQQHPPLPHLPTYLGF